MKESYQRIELEVEIPGPMLTSQPLSTVERTFLNRSHPGLAEKIDQGQLGRMIDYSGNYFLLLAGVFTALPSSEESKKI